MKNNNNKPSSYCLCLHIFPLKNEDVTLTPLKLRRQKDMTEAEKSNGNNKRSQNLPPRTINTINNINKSNSHYSDHIIQYHLHSPKHCLFTF